MSHGHRRFEELKAGGRLPSPQGVALKLLELATQPDIPLTAITRLVQTDPAMAGRILRYANAARGGALRHIASLHHAITLLGLFRVRQIAIAFSLIDHYRNGSCPGFDYAAYWSTALATGISAQQLAPQAQCPPDESFTCGLLSSIGRLALATAFPHEYGELLGRHLEGSALRDEEQLLFGIHHLELSAEMLASWGLPEIFGNAVRFHECPAQMPDPPGSRAHALTLALHLATHIAQLLNQQTPPQWECIPGLFHAAAQLGLEAQEVTPLLEEVMASWQTWAAELALPIQPGPDIQTLLATAPPLGLEPHGTPMLPLSVALQVSDPQRRERLKQMLAPLGLHVLPLAPGGKPHRWHASPLPDVVIADLGQGGPVAREELQQLRQATSNQAHIIALIAPCAATGFPELLQAGAADYLTYEDAQPALIARLANAQQMIALRDAVRVEREIAINSSGDWARANRRLLHEALTDPLTQLPNRRYGIDCFEQEWAIARSNGLSIACLMLDIDNFKQVNDQRGHDVGDLALRQIAAAILDSCRRTDIVFRYGGEEFCCICPGTDLGDALQLAQRIAESIRQRQYGRREDPFRLTLSIGLALGSPDMPGPEALLSAADQALYDAKQRGRNRVVACP